MFEELLIADSGPLIGLAKIGRLDLLPRLATSVMIPAMVWQEAVAARPLAPDAITVARADWLEIRTAPAPEISQLDPKLDPGEAEAIALALQFPHACLLLDDRLGRREAGRLGLRFLGVVGLLKLAKDQGLIHQLGPELQSLLSVGYHLSSKLVADAPERAGEFHSIK